MVAASPAKQPLDYLPYAIGGFGGTFLLSWCLNGLTMGAAPQKGSDPLERMQNP